MDKVSEQAVDIKKCIPHREPFLLVDGVDTVELGKSIRCWCDVSNCNLLLQGHFPGNPLLPGVLMVEALAQSAGVLAALSFPQLDRVMRLVEVNKARFRREVVPGDRLHLFAEIQKQRGDFFFFRGQGDVDGAVACKVDFTAKMT
ncbi:MAG: 3-hydroxyacyl-[acyl-carrier-protein] dehydratase FabZ [Zetaproteobacteria bacterium]|nr:3-hydroxyacyl-[acyl-carrier-protein] dehydratase FabZ [Pseudobdellovibrionaceae bacterium]